MTLEELVLENFGVYRGRQALNLVPPSRQRPIILIGGLNGVGKTTLLDAVQLALFGKLAPCSNRGSRPYDQYLQMAIHRDTPQADGAGIELAFRHRLEGIERHVRIRRHWRSAGRTVRERLDVEQDGVPDPVLSERWLESVDQFVPIGIARLVFFDGDQIASMADPKVCSQTLNAGISGLLGLDVVDRLTNDLSVYERRQRVKLVPATSQESTRRSEEALRQLTDERDRLVIQRGERQNAVDLTRRRLAESEDLLQLQGGESFQQRTVLESRQESLSGYLQEAQNELGAALSRRLLSRSFIRVYVRGYSLSSAF